CRRNRQRQFRRCLKLSERQQRHTASECYALRHAILLLAKKESSMSATWKHHEKHGRLTKQSDLPDSVFAFPKQRKEPLTHISHSLAEEK
ncbi:MAG TPA: hypothetical protein VNO32_01595, partial [Candidatus Acidoferrum sp.]|nr:hypothetical protein [Candidatus Acidoferrum sp.]